MISFYNFIKKAESLKIHYVNKKSHSFEWDLLYIVGGVGVSSICTPWLAPWEIDPDLPLDRGGVDFLKIPIKTQQKG